MSAIYLLTVVSQALVERCVGGWGVKRGRNWVLKNEGRMDGFVGVTWRREGVKGGQHLGGRGENSIMLLNFYRCRERAFWG